MTSAAQQTANKLLPIISLGKGLWRQKVGGRGMIQFLEEAMATRQGDWKFRPDLYFRALGTWAMPIIELPSPSLIAVVHGADPAIDAAWERLTSTLPKPAVDHAGFATCGNQAEFLRSHPSVDASGIPHPIPLRPSSSSVGMSRASATVNQSKTTITVRFRFSTGKRERIREAEMPIIPRVGDFIEATDPDSKQYRVESVVFGIDPKSKNCTRVIVNLGK